MPVLKRSAHALRRLEAAADGEPVYDVEREAEPFAEGDAHPMLQGTAGRKAGQRRRIFPECAHPDCRMGWLRLWRSRSQPIFEGGWCCSPECTRARVEAALRRELDSAAGGGEGHRHRIPLGLAMLEQGWISATELRRALAAQREARRGRLGEWLRRQGVSEALITRALGVQWSCPVLSLDQHLPGCGTAVLPRLFVDAYGALPLRTAAEKILYLGFEERLDPALALAVERMTGLRVESGLVEESRFRRAHAQALEARYPPVELVEAASEAGLAAALAQAIERARAVDSRLVRVHDCIWLRLWLRPQTGAVPSLDAVRDLIASPGWLR